jgi:hypothetical protein
MDTPLSITSKIIQPQAAACIQLFTRVNLDPFECLYYSRILANIKRYPVGCFVRLAADTTVSMPAIIIHDHTVSGSAHLRSIRYLNERYIQTLHIKELVFLENKALITAWCRDLLDLGLLHLR